MHKSAEYELNMLGIIFASSLQIRVVVSIQHPNVCVQSPVLWSRLLDFCVQSSAEISADRFGHSFKCPRSFCTVLFRFRFVALSLHTFTVHRPRSLLGHKNIGFGAPGRPKQSTHKRPWSLQGPKNITFGSPEGTDF